MNMVILIFKEILFLEIMEMLSKLIQLQLTPMDPLIISIFITTSLAPIPAEKNQYQIMVTELQQIATIHTFAM